MNENEKIIKAKPFDVINWVDKNGQKIDSIELSGFNGQFKIIFCFQSWCPGCHSIGFPSLKKMVDALENNPNIIFLAIQTVFEGFTENSYDKMLETQKQYDLKIPFGHDAGNDNKSQSNFMTNYQTGGTPWFVFIDQNDNIVFADFHLNVDAAIDFLKTME